MPLVAGSAVGPDASVPESLFLRFEDASVQDERGTWVYCGKPNGRFASYVTLRNDGPLPLTVLGAGEPARPADANGFRLTDLAAYRLPMPADTPVLSHQAYDPWAAPVLAPTTLEPGAELEAWARFAIGDLAHVEAGAGVFHEGIGIRYSVLGIARSAEVTMRDDVGIERQACAA